MSKPIKPKKSKEEIAQESRDRMKALNEKRKKQGQQPPGDEGTETPAGSETQQPEETDATSEKSYTEATKDRITLDGPVEKLPVPDITKESPFGTEPIIHGHANIGDANHAEPVGDAPTAGNAHGEAPAQPGETTVDGEAPQPVGDNPGSAPPIIEGQQGPQVGPNGEILGEQPGTMPITKSQVRQTFETFCSMFNYMVGNYAPFITKLKLPTEIEHLRMEEAERFKQIAESLSAERIETLKLSQNEIEMLRDSAEAVLAESGKVLTPAQMLMIVGLQILISKLGIIWQIRSENKSLITQIRTEITVMIAHTNGLHATVATMQQKIDALENEKRASKPAA